MNINKHIIIIAKYRTTKKFFILYIYLPCKNRGNLKIRYWYDTLKISLCHKHSNTILALNINISDPGF